MFPGMRRSAQALTEAQCEEILRRSTSGVLALEGDDGYPYAVPMSYVYTGGKIIFHSALTGHKIDAVKRQSKCSFCVISRDEVIPEKLTTAYLSVIVFGQMRIIAEGTEKREALEALAEKYNPGGAENVGEIETAWNAACVMELTAEHISGKRGRETRI